jgi:hypothetical protein
MAKRQSKEKAAVLEGELVLTNQSSDEDEQTVLAAGQTVIGFLKSVSAFFTTARTLEHRALATRDRFRAMPVPTSMEADEQLQREIRTANEDKREVEDHWKITAVISGFHRRMTARRAKATDALEEAARLGNANHNSYVQAEKRRAEEENRRREEQARRDAEERQRLELERMEAEAVKREEAAGELSGREQVFVEQIAGHGDGLRAARQAGFPDPAKSSTRLLKLAKIQAAIKGAQEAAAIRRQAVAAKARPVQVDPVPYVAPQVTRAPGAQDRSYHYGDLVDEQALVAAILSGNHGIPTDLLRIDTSKLNGYAKDLGDRINRWPGVRYRKETKVV